ncbi:DUF1178 family protein [Novosphingobium album (ex Liu et al. 2023)]|uniref:DUF1178 family protein n=1 Tax=Novosphingobium album (ex Liu et al. 2023) TaxID=3031130 RepID=A0ABT5WWH5_9SPHN|nr:DUF1178 family protein [Novosphingobium album (ex Liu et al. 2023)]MDE8654203.1 DUF1178 family protein [Novosphingobium album (ex Liu et al. 2023)]
MIVFDLECHGGGHRFEGWFGSSQDFARQQERGLVVCPQCGSPDVGKAVMAPRVARKGNQLPAPAAPGKRPDLPVPAASSPVANSPLPPEAVAMMHKLARMQAEALKQSRYVGENFAEDARAMHYGECDAESIHGQTTIEEARDLIEEGIPIAPLPFPVTPPDKAN